MSVTRKPKASPTPESSFVLPSSTPAVAGGAIATPPTEGRTAADRRARLGPHPSHRPGTLLVGSEVEGNATALLRREAEGLQRSGARIAAMVESQQQLLGELRTAVQELDDGAAGDPRVRIAANARAIGDILGWCEAVQVELSAETARAADGIQAVDLLLLCHDVIHDLGAPEGERQVQVTGSALHTVWGRVPELGRLLRLAFELVSQRTAGWSDLQVAVGEDADGPFVHVHGLGGARQGPDAEQVADFRAAAAATGLRVLPDASGVAGTGLLLRAPAHLRGPLVD